MKWKGLWLGFGLAIAAASAAGAATITTNDGVLSIETPSDAWIQTTDPNHWFVLSDGGNYISIDHLSNGESLPAVSVADANYGGVYQAFVSTENEVFVVKGMALTKNDLPQLMQMLGTVKVLQYDTKTAIGKESLPFNAAEFGLREINADYYCTSDDVNVRNGCSQDDAVLGSLNWGDKVTVTGAVTMGGADYGWYQIRFNSGTGYVYSGYLSVDAPSSAPAADSSAKSTEKTSSGDGSYAGGGDFPSADSQDKQEYVQCEYCGNLFAAGNDYRNHVMAAHIPEGQTYEESQDGLYQCEICGEWFTQGVDYLAHKNNVHGSGGYAGGGGYGEGEGGYTGEGSFGEDEGGYAGSGYSGGGDYGEDEGGYTGEGGYGEEEGSGQELVQCEYCGEWFQPGNDYRNHVMAAHSDAQ